MRSLGKYIPACYAVAFWGLIPLLHSTSLNDPVLYPQLLGLVVGCMALAAVGLWQWRAAVELPWQVWIPFAGLIVLTGLSSIWSLNPAEAWLVSARWSAAFAFLFLTQLILKQSPGSLLGICKVIIVSMSLLAGIGLLQMQGIDPLHLSDLHHSPVGMMANRNFYGSALVLGMCFALYGFFKLPSTWRILAAAATLLMMVGVVASGARAALVPLLIGLVVLPPAAIWRRAGGKMKVLGLVGWLTIVAFAGWSAQYVLGRKDAKFNLQYLWEDGRVVTPASSSLDHRLIGWHQTIEMGMERPWRGYGAGNWKMQIHRLGLQSFDDQGNFGMVVPLHPHNEFFASFAELGIPGLLLLLSVIGLGVWGAIRQIINRDGNQDSILGGCLGLAWIAILVDASFSFPWERPLHLMLFCLVIALSVQGLPSRLLAPSRLKWALVAALALLALAGLDLVTRMGPDLAIKKIRDAKMADQPQRVLQLAPQATNWAVQIDPVAALSIDWYVGMAQLKLGRQQEAMDAFDRAARVTPHHLAQRSGRASLLDIMGRYEEAILLQTDLLQVFPNFDEGWLNLSIMHVHAGHLAEGRRILNRVPRAQFQEMYDKVDAVLDAAHY